MALDHFLIDSLYFYSAYVAQSTKLKQENDTAFPLLETIIFSDSDTFMQFCDKNVYVCFPQFETKCSFICL